MPIYEYICQDCKTKFEKLVFDKNKEITCEKCMSRNVKKVFSSFATVSSSTSAPVCSSGACPSSGMGYPGASPCSSGSCPF